VRKRKDGGFRNVLHCVAFTKRFLFCDLYDVLKKKGTKWSFSLFKMSEYNVKTFKFVALQHYD